MDETLTCLLLTLKVGLTATSAILVIGTALGYALSRERCPGQTFVEALLLLPMTMPPVAVGLVLLTILAPDTVIGDLWEACFGERLLLSWPAAAIAAFVVALPLYVRAAQEAFRAVPERLAQVPATLGLGPWKLWWRVRVPLAAPGLAAGALLAFARSLGEFGATNLVAGSIPGRTQTLALAIYGKISNGHDAAAWRLAGWSAGLAFAATLGSRWLSRRYPLAKRLR